MEGSASPHNPLHKFLNLIPQSSTDLDVDSQWEVSSVVGRLGISSHKLVTVDLRLVVNNEQNHQYQHAYLYYIILKKY